MTRVVEIQRGQGRSGFPASRRRRSSHRPTGISSRPNTKIAGRTKKNTMPMYGFVCSPNTSSVNTITNKTPPMVASSAPRTDTGCRRIPGRSSSTVPRSGHCRPIRLRRLRCTGSMDSVRMRVDVESLVADEPDQRDPRGARGLDREIRRRADRDHDRDRRHRRLLNDFVGDTAADREPAAIKRGDRRATPRRPSCPPRCDGRRLREAGTASPERRTVLPHEDRRSRQTRSAAAQHAGDRGDHPDIDRAYLGRQSGDRRSSAASSRRPHRPQALVTSCARATIVSPDIAMRSEDDLDPILAGHDARDVRCALDDPFGRATRRRDRGPRLACASGCRAGPRRALEPPEP